MHSCPVWRAKDGTAMAESTVTSDSRNTAKPANIPGTRNCIVTLLKKISINLVVRKAIGVIQIKVLARNDRNHERPMGGACAGYCSAMPARVCAVPHMRGREPRSSRQHSFGAGVSLNRSAAEYPAVKSLEERTMNEDQTLRRRFLKTVSYTHLRA